MVLSNLLASSTGLYERLVKDQSGEDGDGVEDVLESYDTVLGWIWTILSLAVPGMPLLASNPCPPILEQR